MPDRNHMTEIGSTGLERHAGIVHEEFLPQLTGDRALHIYQEMSNNDPVIGAILFAIDMLVRRVPWFVDSADEEEPNIQAAEFVESLIEDMSLNWRDVISEIMSMLVYGFSFHEIVYKQRLGNAQKDPAKRSKFDDGLIGWRKLPIRAQTTRQRWEFDDNGGIEGMWQIAPPRYDQRFIPITKALLFRTQVRKNNPEGRSILRNAYRPWYFKKNIEEIEGVGIERDLAGLPVAHVPPELLDPSCSASERAILSAIKDIVTNIRRDEQEGVVFPLAYDENGNKMYDLELLSAGGARQFDTDAVIGRYDQRMAMTVLADFILLGHENVGSFALGKGKTELFGDALQTWLDSIAEVFNQEAIPRIFELNNMDTEELPKLRPGQIQTPDIQALADYISKLSGTGMPIWPDRTLEDYLREIASLPQREEED